MSEEAKSFRSTVDAEVCACGHARAEHNLRQTRTAPLGCRLCSCLCFDDGRNKLVKGPAWERAMAEPKRFGGF